MKWTFRKIKMFVNKAWPGLLYVPFFARPLFLRSSDFYISLTFILAERGQTAKIKGPRKKGTYRILYYGTQCVGVENVFERSWSQSRNPGVRVGNFLIEPGVTFSPTPSHLLKESENSWESESGNFLKGVRSRKIFWPTLTHWIRW